MTDGHTLSGRDLNRVLMRKHVHAVPPGTRLQAADTAQRLGLSFRDMAHVLLMSPSAVSNLLHSNWPVRRSREELQAALRQLLAERGATEQELAALFTAATQSAEPAARSSDPEEAPMLLAKQSLTPQARRHFKLPLNPFDGEVTSDELMFSSADIDYAREALWQCARQSSFVALVGESGAGKTTLLQDLQQRLEREPDHVIVIRPGVLGMEGNDRQGKTIKAADILHAIVTELAPTATMPLTLQARTVKAGKLLSQSAQVGNAHLLVVEEAHSMPDATLKHLKRLHEMRLGRRPLLGILLLAQPELKSTLATGLRDGSLREVAQRCEIVELLPLDADLRGYLQRRAAAARVDLASLFENDAIETIRERLTVRRRDSKSAVSICYPLAVNNLVTKALNAAAEIGAAPVTKDIVANC